MNFPDKNLTKLSAFNTKYKALDINIDKQKLAISKEFQKELKIAFKQFFEEVPSVEAFVFTIGEDDDCNCDTINNWIGFIGFIPKSLGFLAHRTGFMCDYNDAPMIGEMRTGTSDPDVYSEKRFKKEFSPQEIKKISQMHSFIRDNQQIFTRAFDGYYDVMITKTGRILTQ